MKKKRVAKRWAKLIYILTVAAILLFAIALVVVAEYFFMKLGIVEDIDPFNNSSVLWIVLLALASVIIGLILAAVIGTLFFDPIDKLMEGMNDLSGGKYETRLDLGRYEMLKQLSASFNSLAEQLQNTEILRADFVNNFSHELKTPIVSLRGIADLLKDGDVSAEKKEAYLSVLEEEMDRLSEMTTNILNLSRIENSAILTDKAEYNLSEQVRTCVLLLEKKWSKKNIVLDMDFGEFKVVANEDFMRHVLINLIDNAIKFSNEGGVVSIDVKAEGGFLSVTVENGGKIPCEEDIPKIFNKFYRGDNSSESEGNGIGLSIVKHVVEMHGGFVKAEISDGKIKITVTLPAK